MAIQFEKIENKSFHPGFFDKMEKIAYARLIKGPDYVKPEFIDPKNMDQHL